MYVIETLTPEGPHWYAGIQVKVIPGTVIAGAQWSPYWGDRKQYEEKAEAEHILSEACKKLEGAYVVHVEDSLKADGRWSNSGNFYMKAKYLSVNMQFAIANKKGTFTVKSITKAYIRAESDLGEKAEFGKDAKASVWVKLVGKKEVAQ